MLSEPMPVALCEEKHKHIDERCENHQKDIIEMKNEFSCLKKNLMRLQWLLIAAIGGLLVDIVRGIIVLDKVTKLSGAG